MSAAGLAVLPCGGWACARGGCWGSCGCMAAPCACCGPPGPGEMGTEYPPAGAWLPGAAAGEPATGAATGASTGEGGGAAWGDEGEGVGDAGTRPSPESSGSRCDQPGAERRPAGCPGLMFEVSHPSGPTLKAADPARGPS